VRRSLLQAQAERRSVGIELVVDDGIGVEGQPGDAFHLHVAVRDALPLKIL